MSELQFGGTAAAGYDRAVGRSTGQAIPALLRAARLGPGQRVLDIATGLASPLRPPPPLSGRPAASSRPTSRPL